MDHSVIQAGIKGDVKALKQIFDYYVPRMRPLCIRYSRTVFETEDILQESFIKVFQSLKTFKFEGSFDGWVQKIVINTAINQYHKNKKLSFHSFDFPEFLAEEDNSEQEEIEEADLGKIRAIIEQLPDGYRLIFNMFVVDNLSHKEIAAMLNISESTSRSQYFKAKKLINKLLDRQRKANNVGLTK